MSLHSLDQLFLGVKNGSVAVIQHYKMLNRAWTSCQWMYRDQLPVDV